MSTTDDDWLAVGIELHLRTSEDGGRTKPLAPNGYQPFAYRPNWRWPNIQYAGQVGAPVFCFGHHPVLPGDVVRAVIVPLAPVSLHLWQPLRVGDVITLFEGARDFGSATLEWIAHTARHLTEDERQTFRNWATNDSAADTESAPEV